MAASSSGLNHSYLHRSVKLRYFSVILVLSIVVIAIFVKAFFIHTVHAGRLSDKQLSSTHKTLREPAHRGGIYDRFGFALATDMPMVDLWVDQKNVKWQTLQQQLLCEYGGVTDANCQTWFSSHMGQYAKFTTLPWHKFMALNKEKIRGLNPQLYYKRYYPMAESAVHLVGKLNHRQSGVSGLEFAFDNSLKGEPLIQSQRQDRLGRALNTLRSTEQTNKPLKAGVSITTTIDHRIQHTTYEALKDMVNKADAVAGAVVVLSVDGDVLAMTNYPSFDPNKALDKVDGRLRNRAYIDLFEPGSIIKPLSLAAILKHYPSDEHVIDTGSGLLKVHGYEVRDTVPVDKIKLKDVIRKSSNIAMVKLTQSATSDHLLTGLARFGLFDETSFPLHGEPATSHYMHLERDSVSYLTASYGYGIQVTLMKIARAYLILANQGVDPGVRLIHNGPISSERIMDKAVVKRINAMMQSAVKLGTGRRAQIDGVRVAGKTGTTYKHSKGGYEDKCYIASFVGFAPADKPQYIIAVMLDEPKGQYHYGATSAAPVFQKVMDYALKVHGSEPYINKANGGHYAAINY